MSFSFNFDVHACAGDAADRVSDGDEEVQTSVNADNNSTTKHTTTDDKAAEPVKEAREHHPPADPGSLLDEDSVWETVRVGTLPPLHFLNETVLERTAEERQDQENILSRTAAQRSDLISGVYEGGLRVWECTYDLLELLERDGETFGGKAVLDLGCGAALLGILALKRGASLVHFQDYNSTVIDQLTLPNVLLNCEEEEEEDDDDDDESEEEDGEEEEDLPVLREEEEEDEEGEGKEKRVKVKQDESPKETNAKKKRESDDGEPALKKRALEPSSSSSPSSQHASVARCRFFSGDWSTFLALLLKEEPSPKYDIIFTSETIYNAAYYPALHDTLQGLLAPGGLVYLATKAHYFGVGGGLHLFQAFVERRGVFSVERLWDLDEGLQRHVVGLRFRKTKTS